MNKPKPQPVTQEAPTEWRKILLEEGPNGELIPVALEPVTPPPPPSPNKARQQPAAHVPDEWQSIFEEESVSPTSKGRAAAPSLSLQAEAPEFNERTVTGIPIPEFLKHDLQEPSTQQEISQRINQPEIQERLNPHDAPKIPPPSDHLLSLHEADPFTIEAGERTVAQMRPTAPPPKPQRNLPKVIPAPQIADGETPPPAPLPTPLLGRGRAPSETAPFSSSFSPPAAYVPPPDAASTHDLEADEHTHDHTPAEVMYHQDIQDEESFQSYNGEQRFLEETGEIAHIHHLHLAENAEEIGDTTQEISTPLRTLLPPDTLPIGSSAAAPDTNLVSMMANLLLPLRQIQDTLEQQTQAIQALQTAVHEQKEENATLRRHLERLEKEMDTDRDEARFQATYRVFQDLLLLYDYVDLRYRSLWDAQGEHHPTVQEAAAFRGRLLDILKEQEISPIEVNSYDFDPALHRILQEVAADHPSEDLQISRIFRQGFLFREKVFRPTEVEIKRYSPS